jgi:chaperonin GroES
MEEVMAVKPLEDRVLIKPLDAEKTTPGGIVLPDTAKEKPQRGKVVATGPGKLLDSGNRATLTINEGDTVLFGKYAGTEIKIDGVAHQIMRESEVLGIIED